MTPEVKAAIAGCIAGAGVIAFFAGMFWHATLKRPPSFAEVAITPLGIAMGIVLILAAILDLRKF